MKITAVVMMALCAVVAVTAMGGDQVVDPLFPEFMSWIAKFNKTYTSESELQMRYAIWTDNYAKVDMFRKEQELETGRPATGVFGMTKFADLTPEEYSRLLGYVPRKSRGQAVVQEPTIAKEPSRVDWREKGCITPVKNQGQCGSCWAFSATEELESMWILGGHEEVKLSVQQIVSCDKVDAGCNGGDTITAYQYIEKAGGLMKDSEYPYTSGNGNTGQCHDHKNKEIVTTKHHWYATPPCYSGACHSQDEDKLAKNMATTGPVSICVNANNRWQLYTGGVLSSGCSGAADDLDHCVQLVGYNKEASPAYWIVRNSWAEDWGEKGYIYIEMGKNLCGIADEATFVNATKA